MKLTITIPKELEGFVQEALESGEYESAEQLLVDALTLLADAVESDAFADAADAHDEAAQDELLAAMQAKLDDEGGGA